MKNSKAIYIVGDKNLNLVPAINKPTRVSGNNVTIIDHISTNHFLNNDIHSGIITADISDHFPIFRISKYLVLDSSNEPIHITKTRNK